MAVAVYPGTFDPIHYGHIDIVRRSLAIFDRVVVGVYERPQKPLLFSLDERVALAREALRDLPHVEVAGYRSLTVDFARACGARVIIRGLRVISDFELEYQMAHTTRRLAPEVDMVCLMTSLEYAFISSSIVKDIFQAGGKVIEFTPAHVEDALRRRLAARPGG